MALQMMTVEFEIPGSVDGTTPAPSLSFDPRSPDYKAPDADGIVRFSADDMLALTGGDFGLFDPDFGVGGTFADRFIHLIEVRTGGGGAAAQITVVDARDPALSGQEDIRPSSPEANFYKDECIFVPQGSAIAFAGFTPVVGQPVVIRINVVVWGSVEDYAHLLQQCCCENQDVIPPGGVPTLEQVLDAGNETGGTGILATPDNTVDSGAVDARWRATISRMSLAIALIGAGTPSAAFGVNSVGRIHGVANAVAGGSVATLDLTNPASVGEGGVSVDAIARADVAGSVAEAEASGPGSSVTGYVRAQTAHSALMRASGIGARASGYVHAFGFNSTMLASGIGSHIFGYCKSYPGAGYGATTMQATERGAVAFGAVSYFGEITASGWASFARGLATGGAFVSDKPGRILAAGIGAFAGGVAVGGDIKAGNAAIAHGNARTHDYPAGPWSVAYIFAQGYGSVALGRAYGPNTLLHAVTDGSFVMGESVTYANTATAQIVAGAGGQVACWAGGFAGATAANTAKISAEENGSFAFGKCVNGYIQASGEGSLAFGNVNVVVGGAIRATGRGAFAMGAARAGNDIVASGEGSFAHGSANTGDISVSAANAAQFGPGTNSVADSVRIGGAGLHLKGTAGAFGVAANGQMWITAGGDVYIRSGGANRNISTV